MEDLPARTDCVVCCKAVTCDTIYIKKNYFTILETGKVFESGDICAYLCCFFGIHTCEAFETHGCFQKIKSNGIQL